MHVEATKRVEPSRHEGRDVLRRKLSPHEALEGAEPDEELTGVAAGTSDDTAVVATVDARDEAAHEERRQLDPFYGEPIADVLPHVSFADTLKWILRRLEIAELVAAIEDRCIARGRIPEVAPRHDAADHERDEAEPELRERGGRVVRALFATRDDDGGIVAMNPIDQRIDAGEWDPIRARHVAEDTD